MKKKLTFLMFTLLLAVGWTGDASAQRLPAEGQAKQLTKSAMVSANVQKDVIDFTKVTPLNGNTMPVARAPKRSAADATASATRTYAELAQITYDWVDANGTPHNGVSITEPATNPYQIAYLLGSVYMNKDVPGAKYSTVWNVDVPYNNVYYGWDIPANSRWNYYTATAGTNYSDLVISLPTGYELISSITISNASGTTTLASWNAATAYNSNQLLTLQSGGTTYYLYSFGPQGWSFSDYIYASSLNNTRIGYTPGGNIIIPASQLNGNSSIRVVINARGYNGGETIYVNEQGKTLTTSFNNYTWTFNGASTAPTVTPPDDAGYTVFLVKVKDGVSNAPTYTWAWNGDNSVINYFQTYIDEVQLLTDGTRLNEGTDDAGTMFAYSGELNRFYFLGKGKNFLWGDYDNQYHYTPDALAPTYQMYEEFSPTTTETGDEITDFYSKLLYGNSYNVVHDCRSVNYLEHYFSMSGNNGTDHYSMTNLIFWIPDNRGAQGEREYDEEFLPHVGLYTITLEAEAQPAADYSTSNRMYTVTCDWVSSLNTILDFPVDQYYELWIYEYDAQGNPYPVEKVTDLIQDENGWILNNTIHSYNVEQRDTSYVINYRVIGWPKDATNSYGNDPENGTFYAWSNIDPVLIPGYNNFLAVGVQHYESDFAIDVEHNYYRNFLTLDNQNPNNQLTPKRIEDGEDLFTLYRFDAAKPNVLTKAADLLFSNDGSKVEYLIEYANQYYVDEANLIGDNGTPITGYTDPDALGCPTSGVVANLSQGGGTTPTPQTNVYSHTFTNNPINTATQTINLSNVNWTSTIDWGNTTNPYYGYDNTNGAQIGARNRAARSWSLSTSGIPGTITSIKVVASAYGTNATIGVTVGGQAFGSTQNLSNTSTTRSFTGSASGNINITLTNPNTGGRYFYIKSIEVTYVTNDGGLTLLNSFLDNSTYSQVGIVVFELPWKSINVKLQEGETATSAGYFFIQNDGKLRFIMPAGFNHANLKFVIHNAPVSSNYYDGTFTLSSSTGDTQTITIPKGSSVYGDRDYDCIFTDISSGDVITITGTHTVGSTVYSYSPDFKYIHVYVEGGTDGISENDAINLDAIRFVDQFKAPTSDDTHPYRYGYVLKYEGTNPQESAKPEVPVQHTGAVLNGFYTFDQMIHDSIPTLLPVNVMNADVSLELTTNPAVYYYTLDRKPSTDAQANWLEVSKMQKRENDTYQEMNNKMPDYSQPSFDPVTTPRYDTYSVMYGNLNDYMRYAPIVWTHGEQIDNRRVKWNTERQHNSYGAPIWMTGVGDVNVTGIRVERQDMNSQGDPNPSTTWTDENNQECRLYFLGVDALGVLPTTNMKGEGGSNYYEPYMFRVWVRSKSGMLRGFTAVGDSAGVDDLPGSHLIYNDSIDHNMFVVYEEYTQEDVLNKTLPNEITEEDWPDIIKFGALTSLKDNPNDLEVIVRFYYKVKHINPSDATNVNRNTMRAPTYAPMRANRASTEVTIGPLNTWATTYTYTVNGVTLTTSTGDLGYNTYMRLNGTSTISVADGTITKIVFNGSNTSNPVSNLSTTTGNYTVSGNVGTWTGSASSVAFTSSSYAAVTSVVVTVESNGGSSSQEEMITWWDYNETPSLMPQEVNTDWILDGGGNDYAIDAGYGFWFNNSGSLTIPASYFTNYTDIRVEISYAMDGSYTGSNVNTTVNGVQSPNNNTTTFVTYSWTDVDVTNGIVIVPSTGYLYYKYIKVYGTPIQAQPTPELTAPLDGSTVNVGTNTGSGVSVPVTISGTDLTQDLTISVSGTGFSVSPTTVTAAAANAGATVTVTYTGTDPNATGTMTITSGEVSATVSLIASYSTSVVPELTSPVNGSTIDIGTNTGSGVSRVINVKGNNLTQALTVTITGEGFTGTRDLTISAADANAGTAVTVTYNGTDPNATGTMTVASNEVSATVNLTASYRELVDLNSEHAGYVAQDEKTPTQIFTGIIETLYEIFHGEVVDVIYYNSLGMQSSKPFEGINIVVTRYSDGTTTTTKVVR